MLCDPRHLILQKKKLSAAKTLGSLTYLHTLRKPWEKTAARRWASGSSSGGASQSGLAREGMSSE